MLRHQPVCQLLMAVWVSVLCAALAPATAMAGNAEELVVGQVANLSGLGREFSRDFIAGAKTYFDFTNEKGGVNGKRIKLAAKDDGGLAARTLEKTRELLAEERADVLFGYVGDSSISALLQSELFKQSGVAFFGAASGLSPPAKTDNVYYLRASYSAEADAIVEQFRLLGVTRFGLVTERSEFSKSVAEEITEVIRRKNLTLTNLAEVTTDEKVISAAAVGLAKSNPPQVVIMLGDSITVAQFVKAYRPIDLGASLVSLSTVYHETIIRLIGPQLAHGTMITQVVPNLNSKELPIAIEHLAMMKKYRDEPPTAATFEGFIAARTLVEVLKKTGESATRAGVVAALRKSPRMNVGGIRFEFVGSNARGSNYADIVLLRKDGRLSR